VKFIERWLRASPMRVFLAALFLFVFAGGALVSLPGGRHEARKYHTALVERGTITVSISATGTLKPVREVDVGSQLSGRIAELHVDFDDEVVKDQPLARLDPETYSARLREAIAAQEMAEANVLLQQSALDQARAQLENVQAGLVAAEAKLAGAKAGYEQARRALQRMEALARSENISQSNLDRARADFSTNEAAVHRAEAERRVQEATILGAAAAVRMSEAELQNASASLKQKKAAVEQAELELTRTFIRAPISGVVINRKVEMGQTVAATLEAPTLFTIAEDLRRMEVHVKVDEADIGQVRLNQPTTFWVDAFPGTAFSGTVVKIRKAPETIENVITYTVVVSADNPELKLFPGMTAIVRIVVEERRDILKVPNAVLRFTPQWIRAREQEVAHSGDAQARDDSDEVILWTIGANGEAVAVPVRPGLQDEFATEVVSGALRGGERVILGEIGTNDASTR
jgi:HlyD family secretion protein